MIKFSASEKKACLKKLEAIKTDLEALQDLMGDKPILFGEDKRHAQEMLKEIKGTLRAEYRRTSSGKSKLNPAEEYHYGPAIHETDCAIRVKHNSIPNAQWYTEIYDALINIRHSISGLKK